MENNQNKFALYLFVIFLAVFVGSGIFLVTNGKKVNNNQKITATAVQENTQKPTPYMTRGLVNLENKSGVSLINNPVEFNLLIDSDGENITAFDTIIGYDPLSFDFVEAISLDKNFKVYVFKKDNRLSLTVVKTVLTGTTIFKKSTVVKLVFQAKAKGNFEFKVLPSFENEITQLVNEKTETLFPETNKIKLEIK